MTPVAPFRNRNGGYVFDNASAQTAPRFRALEAVFDPGTKRLVTQLGVKPGWSCLEVGAGSGSIAAWLCELVGPDGRVLATDIDTRHLRHLDLANLTVKDHDLRHASLREGCFDLIHMRLVLMHVPDREQVLQRLVSALKPGGWLLVEDFDSLTIQPDPDANPAESALAALKARLHVMAARGMELRCGRLLDGWFGRLGLVEVGNEGRMFMWHGGSSGADLTRANIEQLRPDILASGVVSESQLQEDLAALSRQDVAFPSPILWAAWGRCPRAP